MSNAKLDTHHMFDRAGIVALVVYMGLAFLFFARGLAGHLCDYHVGKLVGDPGQGIWFLAWLPHALAAGHNPVFTDAVWAPHGINLAWTTWLPLEALIAWPLTATLGPVASYNVLALLSLPLAAWSAFVLCRYLSDSWFAALIGGYLFGFSGYMNYYLWTGDLNLIAVFPVPLIVYVTVRAMRGELSHRALAVSLTALLVAIFLFFTELFATTTMVAGIALILALLVLPNSDRARLRGLLLPIVASYVVALLILSPYLYYIFLGPLPKGPVWPPSLYAADLLFFFLPSSSSMLGRLPFLKHVIDELPNAAYVGYTYVGPVMLGVVAAFGWRNWHAVSARLLVWMLFIVTLLSLGSRLTVAGRGLFPLPGALLNILPLLGDAIAARFTMYLALILALVMALWLSGSSASCYTKCAVSAFAILFLLPNPSRAYWDTPADVPTFFVNGGCRHYLKPGRISVVIPYGWTGNSMLWQAKAGMYFRMAGGYTGAPPAEFERWPAMVALFNGTYLPDPELQLKAFLAAHHVTAVLVDARARDSSDRRQREEYRTVLGALGPAPLEKGGVLIYRFTPDSLAPWRGLNPLDLERRVDEQRFAALLDAVERYLRAGGAPARLNPARLEKMKLIRDDWVGGPNIRISSGLWARGSGDRTIDVGTFGSRGALAALVAKYRPDALRVETMPIATAEGEGGDEQLEFMVMTFDRDGLGRAAALARVSSNHRSVAGARENAAVPPDDMR
jgi:hypothetical protein